MFRLESSFYGKTNAWTKHTASQTVSSASESTVEPFRQKSEGRQKQKYYTIFHK